GPRRLALSGAAHGELPRALLSSQSSYDRGRPWAVCEHGAERPRDRDRADVAAATARLLQDSARLPPVRADPRTAHTRLPIRSRGEKQRRAPGDGGPGGRRTRGGLARRMAPAARAARLG